LCRGITGTANGRRGSNSGAFWTSILGLVVTVASLAGAGWVQGQG